MQYQENKKITDGNYDRSLAVKCVNGTFVGRKTDNIIAWKGIPFVGKQTSLDDGGISGLFSSGGPSACRGTALESSSRCCSG